MNNTVLREKDRELLVEILESYNSILLEHPEYQGHDQQGLSALYSRFGLKYQFYVNEEEE